MVALETKTYRKVIVDVLVSYYRQILFRKNTESKSVLRRKTNSKIDSQAFVNLVAKTICQKSIKLGSWSRNQFRVGSFNLRAHLPKIEIFTWCNSSSLATASKIWRGMILVFLLSRAAFPASSKISAVKYSMTAAWYTGAPDAMR